MSHWTSPEDLRKQVQKLWDRGQLLSGFIGPADRFPLRLTLRTPTSSELSDRFDEVRKWSQDLQARAQPFGYRLILREVRHRVIGLNSIPHEAWIDSLDEAIRFIGKEREASSFTRILDLSRARHPELLTWLERYPHRALLVQDVWEYFLRFITWRQANPKPGIYLRQVDLPGLHTKFIENHRHVLSELLDLCLDPSTINHDAGGSVDFARRYGFLVKPTRIRLRGLVPYDDVTLTADAFAALDPNATSVFFSENEINFLSFPAPEKSLVIFGSGYGFEKLAQAKWLHSRSLYYWGDIDTHGFAILDQLRTHIPHAQSLMMDRDTLLAHREQWGREDRPISRDLAGLNSAEREIYDELRNGVYANNLRLEQERIGFEWIRNAVIALN